MRHGYQYARRRRTNVRHPALLEPACIYPQVRLRADEADRAKRWESERPANQFQDFFRTQLSAHRAKLRPDLRQDRLQRSVRAHIPSLVENDSLVARRQKSDPIVLPAPRSTRHPSRLSLARENAYHGGLVRKTIQEAACR